MSTLFYTLYTLGYLALIVWAGRIFWRTRRVGTLFLILVLFGLIYDNLILSIGNLVGFGPVLQALSWPRFILHQLFLPWIMVSAFEQVRLAGHPWAQRKNRWVSVWIGSAMIMMNGILTRLVNLQLEPVVLDGVNRYAAANVSGPPVVSIVSIAFVGIMGFLLWKRTGWVWTWPIVILVFIIEGVPLEAVRRLFGSGVELLLMISLLIPESRLTSAKDAPLEVMKDAPRTLA